MALIWLSLLMLFTANIIYCKLLSNCEQSCYSLIVKTDNKAITPSLIISFIKMSVKRKFQCVISMQVNAYIIIYYYKSCLLLFNLLYVKIELHWSIIKEMIMQLPFKKINVMVKSPIKWQHKLILFHLVIFP